MAHAKNHDYHILPPSVWPPLSALSALFMLCGAVLWMKPDGTFYLFLAGFASILVCMFGWWRDVIVEADGGEHSNAIRIGLRMGVIMFVISEIFFFVAWFWAYFKFFLFPMAAQEGASGLGHIDVWHLPLINTLILLLSGTFVTEAHRELSHGDADNKRVAGLLFWAVLLGISFTIFQVYEYSILYHDELWMNGHPFRSAFFLATMFHGFHVVVGTIFLLVCMFRAKKNAYTKNSHVGFEAAAWYWHFVDVVWLFLFVAVYIVGILISGL